MGDSFLTLKDMMESFAEPRAVKVTHFCQKAEFDEIKRYIYTFLSWEMFSYSFEAILPIGLRCRCVGALNGFVEK